MKYLPSKNRYFHVGQIEQTQIQVRKMKRKIFVFQFKIQAEKFMTISLFPGRTNSNNQVGQKLLLALSKYDPSQQTT